MPYIEGVYVPYIDKVYMANHYPQSPRRFDPLRKIFQWGRFLGHHQIPNPRPDVLPRARSADLMNRELESYLHVREAQDHALTATELERVSGTAQVTDGQRVERHGGVMQEQDKIRRENYLFFRAMERRITAHLAGIDGVSSLDLLRDLRTDLRAHLPSEFPSRLPPGPQTAIDRQPYDPDRLFNDNVPFFEPGNQCLSPTSEDADAIHVTIEGVRNHLGVRKYYEHEHRDQGELADGPREAKLGRADRGYDGAVHGAFNWRPPAGINRPNPIVIDPSPPPFSPITPPPPPFSPITPPPPPSSPPPPPPSYPPPSPSPPPPPPPSPPPPTAPAPPPAPPPAAAVPPPPAPTAPATAPRGRKRKAPADELPPRTKLPRKAKAAAKYT